MDPPGTCRYLPCLPFLSPGWLVGVCSHREMRLSWVLTVLSICVSALVTATGTEGKRKLQIGVKKRADHCPIKSRKGDVLHMHYTVGEGGGALGRGFGDLKGTGSQVSLPKGGSLGQVFLSAVQYGSVLLFHCLLPGWHQQAVTVYCELPNVLSPARDCGHQSCGVPP